MKALTNRQKEMVNIIDDDACGSNWRDWKWQIRHSVKDLDTFEELLGTKLSDEEREKFKKVTEKFPMSVTPYYMSLIDTEDMHNDPVFKQAFPAMSEMTLQKCEMSDPLSEDKDSPVEGITHRYPDRVLFLVSNVCSMYCRHCTRKRRVGDVDFIPDRTVMRKGIDYIKETPQVRDVLLSGGDPFMLDNDLLDWVLSELHKIEHVEVIRIGTRMPVVLPYRINDGLIDVLKKYPPIWINTHFNHPREITSSSRQALKKLADAGIPLGNQSVLLAGVNDCPRIMKALVHKLVANRVRPYYLYQCDLSEGLSHFRTPVGKGIEIMESLIGHTSGFAVPTYVIDAPGGGGKIPVTPNYLVSWSTNKVVLRNYEGVITTYKEPDSYEPWFCNRECGDCKLTLKLEDASEHKCVGIGKLLSDHDKTISLVPENNSRHERRD
ncbi:L-lysine 2,3-aminomutase [Anaerohalosphaera lusitana]|uniref:L-lysine 2,3-aminomutase n=1 Tax=Anaerohalosphaera lusitana TaxID=1936003 RepID=A0A1U9NH51_9BACT|nr:lysine 2,3-aminomutase [Anaerohalosphaera lusitana]AQT67097.1 L-lysine 2,3-aminomutase [Anaerohalosphaera lusitana]